MKGGEVDRGTVRALVQECMCVCAKERERGWQSSELIGERKGEDECEDWHDGNEGILCEEIR